MARLFPDAQGACRLLDAGAGAGSLSAAFLKRWRDGGFRFDSVEVHAFELDREVIGRLAENLAEYQDRDGFRAVIHEGDFILSSVQSLSGCLFSPTPAPFTHAILNPPYKKLGSNSPHRRALREIGIETVNLYAAFVALAVARAANGGQIVAIIPRSFCNGPYYRPFRDFILRRTAIRHIHLFDSRTSLFKDDNVLQENVIIRLERDAKQGPVTISTSSDDTFPDITSNEHPFNRIVTPGDPERFIHIPTTTNRCPLELSPAIRATLADLDISVSTGPVVGFRVSQHLRDMPEKDSAPLLHPAHFAGNRTTWPLADTKKPNAIQLNADTRKWLYPNGYYCVVRRISSKEEPRRIVAGVVEPDLFKGASALGFENHLNLFHRNKRSLPEPLARGLAVFLNSTMVDERFRCFSGHTQVNATDLRQMKYPTLSVLLDLGEWVSRRKSPTQAEIDAKLMEWIT